MSVHVSLEFTPNPETLKYAVSQPLVERGVYDFTDRAQAAGSPLAESLFAVEGVAAVMIARDFVTVTVGDQGQMMEVNTAMLERVKAHLESGAPAVSDALRANAHGEDDSEVARKVKAILDEQIRPAVAMDGGDIVFDKFEAGVVYLQLKGSCSGCPSSMATLKHGVEQRLRHLVPEVQAVEAVEA